MHRFYLPPAHCSGPALALSGREAHHALHVLRVRQAEAVTVLDGAGQECICRVAACGRNHVQLDLLERRHIPPSPYQITLLQALPKGKTIETIIQKGTELGVYRIVPVLSERVVVQIKAEETKEKTAKWQSVAVEAIKQCGSAWLPKVEPPVTPRQFLARGEHPELALIGSLAQDSRHPREYFREFQQAHGRKPSSVFVWVGPEGDFTSAELELAQAGGARPITLGPLVLRSETAAVYCLSVINYELRAPF